MKPSTICSCVAALTALFMGVPSYGQSSGDPGPGGGETSRFGLEAGATYAVPSGFWKSEHGTGMGFAVSLAYDRPLSWGNGAEFRLEALLGVRRTVVEGSHVVSERETIPIRRGPSEPVDTSYATIEFENVQHGVFDYITLAHSLKYYPVPAVYVGAGVDIGMLLSGSTQFVKNIKSRVVPVDGYGLTEVTFPATESPDPYSKTYPRKNRDDASKFAIGGSIFIGAEIPFGETISIGPRISCALPFNFILPNPELRPVVLGAALGLRWSF